MINLKHLLVTASLSIVPLVITAQRVQIEPQVVVENRTIGAFYYDIYSEGFNQWIDFEAPVPDGEFKVDSMFIDTVARTVELYGNTSWEIQKEAQDEYYVSSAKDFFGFNARAVYPETLANNLKITFPYTPGEALVIVNRTQNFPTISYNITHMAKAPKCACFELNMPASEAPLEKGIAVSAGDRSYADSILPYRHAVAMKELVVNNPFFDGDSGEIIQFVLEIKSGNTSEVYHSCGSGNFTEEMKAALKNTSFGDTVVISEILFADRTDQLLKRLKPLRLEVYE